MRHARSVDLLAHDAPAVPAASTVNPTPGAKTDKPALTATSARSAVAAAPAESAEPATTVDIWTDGACKGNPGPGGWGALLRSGNSERELFGGARDTTNNRMELMAVIEALGALKRSCTVIIHTDSQYVKLGITEWLRNWERRGWKTADRKPVKNVDLWQALDAQVRRHAVQWRWVKGHSGDPGNERADALANRGVEQVLEG